MAHEAYAGYVDRSRWRFGRMLPSRLHGPRLLAVVAVALVFGGLSLSVSSPISVPSKAYADNSCGWVCSQIKHVVIIVKENHSFDNMFGRFPGADGATSALEGKKLVPMGVMPMMYKGDLAHTTTAAEFAMNKGRMNRFYKLNGAKQGHLDVSDSSYTQSEIPLYWAYAQNYTLADHFFSAFAGPSFPQHLAFIQGSLNHVIGDPRLTETAGSTFSQRWGCDAAKNAFVPVLKHGSSVYEKPCWNSMTIADEANKAGVSWHYYANPAGNNRLHLVDSYDAIKHIRYSPQWKTNVREPEDFINDVQNGNLASITWLMPTYFFSDHPPEPMCRGETGPPIKSMP